MGNSGESSNSIRPRITSKGFRTAVKDYTEQSVVEELAANSYDENASVVLVLLDSKANELLIIDNGTGFDKTSIEEVATLGGGNKTARPWYNSDRVYLGSYGYGLKSTLNIANTLKIKSSSSDGIFEAEIDWTKLDLAFEENFPGYSTQRTQRPEGWGTGTIITLRLKNPTDKSHLDGFGRVLSNLPSDCGRFRCYYGFYNDISSDLKAYFGSFSDLDAISSAAYEQGRLRLASESLDSELSDCKIEEIQDKEDRAIVAKIYFAGLEGEKVKALKPALRGIYVRVHGRLLKHNFSEDKFVYDISKYPMFKHSLRAEISIDWLRDQITLSRDGIKFTNEKLEKEFKQVLQRILRRFIQPHLDKILKKRLKAGDVKLRQRLELAKRRVSNPGGVTVPGLNGGFTFVPETDAELAIILAQSEVMKKVDPNYKLIDYNDQAPFDCIIFDEGRRDFIYTELEPTLMEFLGHKVKDNIELIITWTLGKWRTGAKKKGLKGVFQLVADELTKSKGHYKLLEFATESSKKPRKDYKVVVVEQLF